MTYMQLNKDGEIETMHRDETGHMRVTVGPRFTEDREQRMEAALSQGDYMKAYTVAADSLKDKWMPPDDVLRAQNAFDDWKRDEYPADCASSLRAVELGNTIVRAMYQTNHEREQRHIQEAHFDRVSKHAPPIEKQAEKYGDTPVKQKAQREFGDRG